MFNGTVRQVSNEIESVSGSALEVKPRRKVLEANSEEIRSEEKRRRERREILTGLEPEPTARSLHRIVV